MLDEDIRKAIDDIHRIAKLTGYNVKERRHSKRLGWTTVECLPTGLIVSINDEQDSKLTNEAQAYASSLVIENTANLRPAHMSAFDCRNCIVAKSEMEGCDEKGNYHIKG